MTPYWWKLINGSLTVPEDSRILLKYADSFHLLEKVTFSRNFRLSWPMYSYGVVSPFQDVSVLSAEELVLCQIPCEE